jgi:hypothetical protein
MNQLDSLPASNDKFWEGADVHPNIEPKKCFIDNPHFFVRVPGHQAQCKDCWWGFQLDPGDKIVDGHLFDIKGKKVL